MSHQAFRNTFEGKESAGIAYLMALGSLVVTFLTWMTTPIIGVRGWIQTYWDTTATVYRLAEPLLGVVAVLPAVTWPVLSCTIIAFLLYIARWRHFERRQRLSRSARSG